MTFAFLHFLPSLDFCSSVVPTVLGVLCPDVLLSASKLRSVDCNEECLRAPALEVQDVLPRELTVLVDIAAVGTESRQHKLR